MRKPTTAVALALSGYAYALNEAPMITAAAQLFPRDTDPGFVGFISQNGEFSNPRSCEYSETVSTSGSYFQCCPTASGSACNFYTTCSDNTLYAPGSVSVDCYQNTGLQCNTGIVLQTAGQEGGGASYLACWQTSLGSSAFTFVQTTGASGGGGGGSGAASTGSGSGSGSSAAATMSATSSSGSGGSSSSGSAAQSTGATGSSSASASQSANAAAEVVAEGMGAKVVGAAVALVGGWML
ncbi:uncharacterized protein AB675_1083 [Cyphellophora attinorum]|uniref:Uncharacterized protein n=1 Tax=Cyphellophora attinorum TaxID=1664694 RepID=A0A0N0NKM9_9EURO|nr:uncharacterized protein AB675_1083 [Phialophora attinorum]KPI38218.1 hypothetical protein AB675_1083 [Phialophora attinorum]